MKSLPTILVVDDEPAILRLFRLALSQDYRVLTAELGNDALKSVSSEHPDLVLLDLVLRDMSGLDVLRAIKADSDIPVVLVTARSGEAERIQAVELGADDFIAKPFVAEHVAASIRFLLTSGEDRTEATQPVKIGDVEINIPQRTVRKSGEIVRLTRSEWMIIEELARGRGEPRLHQELLSRVWGSEYRNDIDYLAVWIKRLRAKLGEGDNGPRIILPYLDVGYRLNVARHD